MPDFSSMGGGLGSMMAGLQQQMQRMQEEAAATEVTGTAGGGLVQVTCNGQQEILRVQIAASATADREMLEDLVTVACNDAIRRSKEVLADKLGAFGAGLGLPPGLLG